MSKLTWRTEQRRVKELLPFKQNPRKMSQKQTDDLIKSFKKFDLVEIPAIDTENRIIAGHQRCAVLQLMGRGEEMIDVRVPSRALTEREYKQYMITSNKVHGDWDEEILSEYFETDLLLESGFTQEEITNLTTDILESEDDKFNVEKEVKKIKKPKSKLGDVY